MSLPGRTALVLGATGMLGQALYRTASQAGFRVAGVARANADYVLDATDRGALEALLTRLRPQLVINAAAQTSLVACERDPASAYAINARLVAVLAGHCRQQGARLVHISTDHFFTGDSARLHDERAPVWLLNEYARTKYAGEAYAATCPGSLVVRTNVVGFRGWLGRPTFVEWAIAALRSGELMTLFADFYTSSIDVDRFATVLFDLLGHDAQGLINVGASAPADKQEFILLLARRLGMDASRCRTGSVREMTDAPRAESLGLDVRRAEGILGYSLPDTQAVIEHLAKRFEEQRSEIR
jgi:dTDP-4-dehydrorhamnose reductase